MVAYLASSSWNTFLLRGVSWQQFTPIHFMVFHAVYYDNILDAELRTDEIAETASHEVIQRY